jgi:DNA repair exonuclease SbcCD ATPase subunit
VDYKISLLSNQISDKVNQLETLNQKLAKQKDSLTQILKKTQSIDDANFVNFILDDRSLSEYFSSANNYISLQSAINDNLNEIKNTTNEVTAVKNDLQDSKDSQLALKQQQELAAKNIASTQSQKNTLLKETKGQEAIYQKQLKDTQAAAAKIRSALFALAGGSSAISFGSALDLANIVSQNENIEPAFLLAIVTQESNLGANVGKCYLTNDATGAGVSSSGKTFTNVMKPSRDVSPFIKITTALGIDYKKQVVSCPIQGVAGYGGAMGPAQFIPST